MRVPFGKRGLLAAATITGAVVYWRVRQSRQRAEEEWVEDIVAATAEGVAAEQAVDTGNDDV